MKITSVEQIRARALDGSVDEGDLGPDVDFLLAEVERLERELAEVRRQGTPADLVSPLTGETQHVRVIADGVDRSVPARTIPLQPFDQSAQSAGANAWALSSSGVGIRAARIRASAAARASDS